MISQATSYAIFALSRLEGPEGEFSLVRNIAVTGKIPPDFLAKIFTTLRERGLVFARRGVGGGVRLTKEPKEVSLLEVCQVMDDPILEEKCLLGLQKCDDQSPCPVHDFWKVKRPEILKHIEAVYLPDVRDALAEKGYLEL